MIRSPILAIVALVTAVTSDTVHYTNSPRHLVTTQNYTTYKLAVPGSQPITIIEATRGPPREAGDGAPGSLNEIRRKDWIQDEEVIQKRKNSKAETFTGNSRSQSEEGGSKPRTTVYSPDLLKKFLADYADRIRKSNQETKDRLQEMVLVSGGDSGGESDAGTDLTEMDPKYFDSYSPPKYNGGSNNWNSNNDDKRYPGGQTDNRYDRPGNWVTMDVIPWSSSKVQKWQGNVQKVTQRPPQSPSFPEYPRPIYADEFDELEDTRRRPMRPQSSSEYDNYDANNYNYNGNKPSRFPSEMSKPHEGHSYYDYNSKPGAGSLSKRPTTMGSVDSYSGSTKQPYDFYRPWNSDIITDNRAPDFPVHSQVMTTSTNRRPANNIYDRFGSVDRYHQQQQHQHQQHHQQPPHPYDSGFTRPETHPESGDGEWVLVSTTKGYHFPRNGQRAIALKPPPFSTHKSVQLTVLPETSAFSTDSGSNRKGLAEALETAKPAKESVKKKKKAVNSIIKTTNPDSSAILAAVGAGMVPATVAMLMPMIAGRRRKRRDVDFAAFVNGREAVERPRNVTHFPSIDYEETIPRNLNPINVTLNNV